VRPGPRTERSRPAARSGSTGVTAPPRGARRETLPRTVVTRTAEPDGHPAGARIRKGDPEPVDRPTPLFLRAPAALRRGALPRSPDAARSSRSRRQRPSRGRGEPPVVRGASADRHPRERAGDHQPLDLARALAMVSILASHFRLNLHQHRRVLNTASSLFAGHPLFCRVPPGYSRAFVSQTSPTPPDLDGCAPRLSSRGHPRRPPQGAYVARDGDSVRPGQRRDHGQ